MGQCTHPADFFKGNACPLSMTCSPSGNLVFAGFSNDTLRMIDSRISDKKSGNLVTKFLKDGGHTGLVKSLCVSSDESVLYSGGVDSTVRIWDIGTRRVIETLGDEKRRLTQSYMRESSFH